MSIRYSSLKEITTNLHERKVSSVELTREYLRAIEEQQSLGAFLAVAGDSALASAEKADQAIVAGKVSALTGVPLAVKDLILTKGLKTTAASKILANFIPPYDATVSKKILTAGGVVLGKTNLDEFGMGSSNENSSFGNVLNPWNKERVPGGSSGGSAVAVAAGLAPFALGTDTGGSIRQPASFCGITGIKPTYGRVSRFGVVAYASSLDQVGVFTRTVEDAALALEVISGKDPLDATSVDLPVPNWNSPAVLERGVKGLRIGLPKEYFIKGLEPAIDQALRKAVDQLSQLGAEVVEISLPHTEYAAATYYIIAPAEASSNLSRYDGIRFGHRAKDTKDLLDLYCRSRSEGFGAEVQRRILIGTYVLSQGYYDAYYIKAQKVRNLIKQDFEKAFASQCDVIACPAAPTTAFKIGENVADPVAMYLNDVFTIPASLAGLPGMTIPCGFDGQGLPIGMQLIASAWSEDRLFAAGHAYQQVTDWHKHRPELA